MKEQPVQILARLLVERGIRTDVSGEEIGFVHLLGEHFFNGQAAADAETVFVEFWDHHKPDANGESKLKTRLDASNQNVAMTDGGVRWMRIIFSKGRLGFVALLNKGESLIDEATARNRLKQLMELMVAFLSESDS